MTHSGWRQGIVTITYEKLVIALMLLLSLPNTFMLIASSILLALYMLVWQRKRGGAVKALIFIAMRTPLSTGFAATYENYAIVKWALLLGVLAISKMWRMSWALALLSLLPMALLMACATVVGRSMERKWDIRQAARRMAASM